MKVCEYAGDKMIGNWFGSKGCEESFTTMPLILYGEDMGLIEPHELMYCKEQF